MLVGTPPYAPTILYSQHRMRSGRNLKRADGRGPFGTWQPGIYRLVMVREGRHHVDLTDATFDADAGSVYLIQPGCLRWVRAGRGSLAHVIGFIAARVPGAELVHEEGHAYRLRQIDHRQPSAVEVWGRPIASQFSPDLSRRVAPDIAQLVAIAWRDPWQRAEADQLLGRILMTMARSDRPTGLALSTTPTQAPEAVTWLHGFEHRVDRHLATLRTTADLAALVRISPDHFARVFSEVFGCRPIVYLRHRRLQETARHLQHSDADLATIAGYVGYRDATALAHAWRQAHATTPGRWRRAQRQHTPRQP